LIVATYSMKVLICLTALFQFNSVFCQIQETSDTNHYHFKVKLLKEEKNTPGCGVFAWALIQEFEVIESDFKPIKPNFHIQLIQPCPEFLGHAFFQKKSIYSALVGLSNDAPFGYNLIGSPSKILPIFWIRTIERVIQ